MEKLKDSPQIMELRTRLIQFLNGIELNGMAILAIARQAEEYTYAPGELIVKQDQESKFIYFVLTGKVLVQVREKGKAMSMGAREAVTMVGEIAYFNKTPATATVKVGGRKPSVVFRIGYEEFGRILDKFPDVRATLARIGELRVIRHYHGFIAYRRFMDMIGWHKDRFAVNRAFAADLDNAVNLVFKPLLKKNARILEVGDGPGLVCELLYDANSNLLDNLFIQATHLEDAIARPLTPQPSDFLRAHNQEERFDAIVALQVFNVMSRHAVEAQFDIAHNLLKPGGILFAVKSQLLDIRHDSGTSGNLIFNALEEVVEYTWPGAIGSKNLIETSFQDADLDPIMEWNKAFCEKAMGGALTIPGDAAEENRVMLELLLGQAKLRLFDPEGVHYRWLEWKAGQHGFKVEQGEQSMESAFFYHLLRKV